MVKKLDLIFQNSLWLFADKLFKMFIGLIVGIWIVRYLGPDWFGKYSYIMALVILFGSLISFGSEGILVRMLVTEPEETSTIISSAFWFQIGFSIVSFILSLTSLIFLRVDGINLIFLLCLLFVPSFCKGFTVVRHIYESKLQIRTILWIENAIFFLFSFFRIVVIILQLEIIWIFVSFALEGLVSALSIFFYHQSKQKDFSLIFPDLIRIKKILKDSFPLFLAGLAIIVYMKVDQLMIGSILGDDQLGVYSVGVRWSEFWYFIPTALASSFYPELIRLRNFDTNLYQSRFQQLHTLLFWVAISGSLLVQFAADFLMVWMYGNQFQESASILKIHIWSGIFVFLGVAGGNFFLIENLQRYSVWKSLFGLVVNVILNFLWIPIYGIQGAAFATLISQFGASSLFLILFPVMRPLLKMQILSVFFKEIDLWSFFKTVRSKLFESEKTF